ncbi:MAG: KamA family radical SAM protein [Bdellovibrionales bacterium]|nr:KamA family radical SAM protein [Bdellovibrionales bacterium]
MSWEQELAGAYRRVEDLVADGYLSQEEALRVQGVAKTYQLLIPKYYASLIDKRDPGCPIRLQAIPQFAEQVKTDSDSPDPLEDLKHQPALRITHRYKGRVLLHLTPNCSMYCRFCFRKSLLNELKGDLFSGGFTEAIAYISKTIEIEEVIFSGGDPFMVGEEILKEVLSQLSKILHLKRVRFHTRVPVTLPSRVTPSFVEALASSRFHPVVVTHFNHPREITPQSSRALLALGNSFTVLNQSVLLRSVNDNAQTLIALSEQLFEMGVLPYYLHHPDPAEGTSQFYLSVEEGKRIWEAMRRELPGYLVPRYVKDVVGEAYKRDVISS